MKHTAGKWKLYGLGVAALSAWVGLTPVGCSKSRGATSTSAPSHDRTNVVVLTLCTLRADHLGCYGYERPTSPNIDALAAEGVRFDYTLTQAPWTRASVSAMVTGLFPRTLNIAEPDRRDEPRKLHESFTTLAERMKEAGYFTIGVTANAMLNSEFGFQQGYDFWHDTGSSWKRAKRKGLLRMEDLTEILFEGIEKSDGERFFAHLVNVDVHDPRKDDYPLETPAPFASSPKKNNVDRYDLRIRYLDEQIGKLRKRLAEAGLGDTLFIINADHGEGLGGFHPDDHGHGGRLYNSTVRVPWIVQHPGLKPVSRSVSSLVQNIDLAPTLLDLLGVNFDRSSMAGTSRAAAVSGSGEQVATPFSIVETEFKYTHKSAIVTDTWKLIIDRNPCVEYRQTLDPPLFEMYRYRDDPGEKEDAYGTQRDVADALERQLKEWQSTHKPAVTDAQAMATEVREETQHQLTGLGYAGSADDEDNEEEGDEDDTSWAASASSGCWREPVDPVEKADGAPTVVVISVTGLRASHMGHFGYFRPTTPVLDRLAAQSLVWDHCLAADLSAPDAARILMTGSLTQGVAGNSGDARSGVPVDGTLTLAEFARQSGMRTGAFVGAGMFAPQKEPLLGLGFEHFDSPRKKRRSADKVTQRSLKWLQTMGKAPAFVWVSYGDLLRESPVDPCLARMIPADGGLEEWVAARWMAAGSGSPPADLVKRVASYDQNLRFVDVQIGELLDGLCRLGRLDHAVVVLVGEQGLPMPAGERGQHLPTWDDARVPFMLRGFGQFATAPRQISNWVSTVDVAATVVGSVNPSLAATEAVGRDGESQVGDASPRQSVLTRSCDTGGAEHSCDWMMGIENWFWIRTRNGSEQLYAVVNGEPSGPDARQTQPDVLNRVHDAFKPTHGSSASTSEGD